MGKKICAVFLSAIMVFSMPAVTYGGATSFFVEKGMDLLFEVGMRVTAEAGSAISENIGENNKAEGEVCSFITEWAFMNATEVAIEHVAELCEDILQELEVMKDEMEDYANEMRQISTEQQYQSKLDALNTRWDNDVWNVMKTSNYEVVSAVEAFKDYSAASKNYRDNRSDSNKQGVYDAEENLIKSFRHMYSGNINVSSNSIDALKKILFTSDGVNQNFDLLIANLASNLKKSNGTYIGESAASLAYSTYPFSHQQYEFVTSQIENQILNLFTVEMVYNEYLYLQRQYLTETFGEDSDEVKGHREIVKSFKDRHEKVLDKVTELLESEFSVSSSLKLSLGSYMDPKDVQNSATLKVHWYEDYYNYNYDYYEGYEVGKSYAKYTTECMKYNRVKVHTPAAANGGAVFYILGPDQFGTADALKTKSLDYKKDRTLNPDFHLPTCDYFNYTKDYYDEVSNTNVFSATTDMNKLSLITATPAFGFSAGNLTSYLSGYLPAKDKGLYVLTDEFTPDHFSGFTTMYPTYKAVNADSSIADNKIKLEDVYGKKFDQEGNKYSFTTILSQENSETVGNVTYKAHTKANELGGNVYIRMYKRGTDSLGPVVGQSVRATPDVHQGCIIFQDVDKDQEYLDTVVLRRYFNPFDKTKDYTDTVLLEGPEQYRTLGRLSNGYAGLGFKVPYGESEIFVNFNDKPAEYAVAISDDAKEIASVSTNLETAPKGKTINVTSDTDSIKVVSRSEDISLNLVQSDDGKYRGSFTMPADDIIIDTASRAYNITCTACSEHDGIDIRTLLGNKRSYAGEKVTVSLDTENRNEIIAYIKANREIFKDYSIGSRTVTFSMPSQNIALSCIHSTSASGLGEADTDNSASDSDNYTQIVRTGTDIDMTLWIIIAALAIAGIAAVIFTRRKKA